MIKQNCPPGVTFFFLQFAALLIHIMILAYIILGKLIELNGKTRGSQELVGSIIYNFYILKSVSGISPKTKTPKEFRQIFLFLFI